MQALSWSCCRGWGWGGCSGGSEYGNLPRTAEPPLPVTPQEDSMLPNSNGLQLGVSLSVISGGALLLSWAGGCAQNAQPSQSTQLVEVLYSLLAPAALLPE